MIAADPVIVKVHVLVLLPPLEHAPDHTASRPFVTLSVTASPVENEAEPLDPTATLIPAGFDVTRSPDRPVAVSVSVAVCDAGVTVRAAVRVDPPALAFPPLESGPLDEQYGIVEPLKPYKG